MSSTTAPWETEKAYAAGVSFNPGTLYGLARSYGNDQDPKLGPSDVVCMALTEFFVLRGSLVPAKPTAITAPVIKALSEWTKVTDGADIVPVIKAAMRDSVRRQSAAKPKSA